MAFKGMNPEEGREVAQSVTEAGERILEIVGNVGATVNSVEWVGPDYDSYREDWNAFLGGAVDSLITLLQDKGRELTQHAEQQDTTSNQG